LARRRFRRFGLPISAPPRPTVLVPQAARAGSWSSCRSRRRPRRRAASTPSAAKSAKHGTDAAPQPPVQPPAGPGALHPQVVGGVNDALQPVDDIGCPGCLLQDDQLLRAVGEVVGGVQLEPELPTACLAFLSPPSKPAGHPASKAGDPAEVSTLSGTLKHARSTTAEDRLAVSPGRGAPS
jgi:hypothetical protein